MYKWEIEEGGVGEVVIGKVIHLRETDQHVHVQAEVQENNKQTNKKNQMMELL